MKIFFPNLLSRQKALLFTGLSRHKFNLLIKEGKVRFFTTKGGHRRFFRDDLIQFIYEQV